MLIVFIYDISIKSKFDTIFGLDFKLCVKWYNTLNIMTII